MDRYQFQISPNVSDPTHHSGHWTSELITMFFGQPLSFEPSGIRFGCYLSFLMLYLVKQLYSYF